MSSGTPEIPDNHHHWEQLAAFHGTGDDDFYDLSEIISGGTRMGAAERAAVDRAMGGENLSGLAGRRVAHLQCHLGLDAITMARAGAEVTGIDFSSTALRRAEELASACGVSLTTVIADSRDLPDSLNASFDLVYASIGVIYWIDDLAAFMAGVERILAPGGRFVLVDLHPMLTMIGSLDPLVLDFPYGGNQEFVYSGTGTYANRDAEVSWTVASYPHSVAEIVMAVLGAQMQLSFLDETCATTTYTGGVATKESDGVYRIRLGRGSEDDPEVLAEPIPLLLTVIATANGEAEPTPA